MKESIYYLNEKVLESPSLIVMALNKRVFMSPAENFDNDILPFITESVALSFSILQLPQA